MKTELTKAIGENIKDSRLGHVMTVGAMAHEIDVMESTLANWERGVGLTIAGLEKIAAVLECSVVELFPGPTSIRRLVQPLVDTDGKRVDTMTSKHLAQLQRSFCAAHCSCDFERQRKIEKEIKEIEKEIKEIEEKEN